MQEIISAPANCLAENTEHNISFLGDLENGHNFESVTVDDLESCREYCRIKEAKYFTYVPDLTDCFCMSSHTEHMVEDRAISGNTNLSMCYGEQDLKSILQI